MKRLILLSVLTASLVFGFCYLFLAPKNAPPAATAAVSRAIPALQRPVLAASTPRLSVIASVQLPQPVTSDRRRIFDSENILATIEAIRINGSPDEKEWANFLVVACTQITKDVAAPPANDRQPEPEEVVKRKAAATNLLRERCSGVGKLTSAERISLRSELLKDFDANQSVLAELRRAGASRDGRWSSEQVSLVTDSLYSGDPIVAKSAFLALMASFDDNAPGGADRLIAFRLALAPVYLNFPLSEFESLDACRSNGWCNGTYGDPSDTRYSDEIIRLVAAYKAARDSRMDARSLLSIR